MTEDDKEALREFLIGVLNVALLMGFFILAVALLFLF